MIGGIHCIVDLSQASTHKELMKMIRYNDKLYENYFQTVLKRAYALSPIRTGTMARSMYQYSYMQNDPVAGRLSIHFEAYAESKSNPDFNYAYIQHENPGDRFNRKKSGKSDKFLEIPFYEETNRLIVKLKGVVNYVWY